MVDLLRLQFGRIATAPDAGVKIAMSAFQIAAQRQVESNQEGWLDRTSHPVSIRHFRPRDGRRRAWYLP
jgi:hypothetical protein